MRDRADGGAAAGVGGDMKKAHPDGCAGMWTINRKGWILLRCG